MTRAELLALAANCTAQPNDRVIELVRVLAEDREALREALNKIASWDEGEIVAAVFDNPDDAAFAREALAASDTRLAGVKG